MNEEAPKKLWRYIPMQANDGPTNMAIDEAILLSRQRGLVPNTIRLYQWSPSTVTIGKHQSVDLEVDLDEIDQRGFQLVRRISGGGAVLHAENKEITYSVIARKNDLLNSKAKLKPIDGIYERILNIIQLTLHNISLSAAKGVVHCPALFIDGKKFSGNAQCIKGNHFLQHGTILLSVDAEEMYSVLKPPTGVTKTRMVRSVMTKVVGLEEKLGETIDVQSFEIAFKKSAEDVLGVKLVNGSLTAEEKDAAKELKKKYDSVEWRMKHP